MGDVYMLNGKILSGLPNHAKDIIFDNDGTTLSSTNTEDAIKEVNSNSAKYETITVNVGAVTANGKALGFFTPTIPTGYHVAGMSTVVTSTNMRCHGSIAYYNASGYGYGVRVTNDSSSSVDDAVATVYVTYLPD